MSNIRSIRICGLSDVGRTRTRNEDAYLIGNIIERTGLIDITFDMSSLGQSRQGFLLAVADGMGGMGGGDVASVLGLEAFSRHYYSMSYPESDKEVIFEAIHNACIEAHRIVSEQSKNAPNLGHMGTTLVGMNIHNGRFYRYHVGDSRLYRFREGYLQQMTKDHSLVQMLMDSGKLTEEDADSFSRKNEITNSIGAGTTCKPEIAVMAKNDIRTGDLFLICSDGLSNTLDRTEVPPDMEALNQLLIQSGVKEKELERIKRTLCGGEYYDTLVNVMEGIDDALSANPTLMVEAAPELGEICKTVSQIHSNWLGWQQLLSIFLAEKSENPIVKILTSGKDLKDRTRDLIDKSNARGAKDNVTVILMEIG